MSEESGELGAKKPVVTFLGPVASYTHQATLDAFPDSTHTLTPVTTIDDVFASVHAGTATRGVVPFENSSNGSVVFTLDLFADTQRKYPDIVVCAESYVAVQHCLLGRPHLNQHATTPSAPGKAADRRTTAARTGVIESPLSSGAVTPTTSTPHPQKPSARPLADLARITKLYSHPQAWGQCNAFLNTYLKGVERQDVSSTSRAAQLVADDESGTSAAVSSAFAAEVCGLEVLARGIEDRADNTTRFFVIRRREGEEGQEGGAHAAEREWKTLVCFTVDHANPGSLAHSLAVFEKYGLNLTSINTRPSGVENWNYIFFVELRGKREEGTEGPVNGALGELDAHTRTTLPPQPLQLPQNNQIRIQKPIHTLPHTRLLVLIQLPALHPASRDALLEADVRQGMDGYPSQKHISTARTSIYAIPMPTQRADLQLCIRAFWLSFTTNCCSSCLSRSDSLETSTLASALDMSMVGGWNCA
ncbi:PDT-domain-containing protein [Karstenula rhodostoma CBS 690.94]|uniref:prephenate dehydratase n=1 Tax=Karstenula rhodostoma CBS 690.94 TaxID=1392251 RepID=A0A9P4PLD9_9PLEO|nr:PDT-domain-containing protein [Karstenula rhodostoma CBS 690.94]